MAVTSMLVFDMDGVLVDVSDSYLASIIATVEHFTGETISNELIQQYKNSGGLNDDWQLSQTVVRDIAKREVPLPEVTAVFQQHFLGADGDGLIRQERWLPANGLMERLATKHQLAIFTGRPRAELELTLARFASIIPWTMSVAYEDVAALKPAPDGLRKIADAHGQNTLTYIGDNIDDARSARAAGVRFIGIAEPGSGTLRELLESEGAIAVIENINKLEEVL